MSSFYRRLIFDGLSQLHHPSRTVDFLPSSMKYVLLPSKNPNPIQIRLPHLSSETLEHFPVDDQVLGVSRHPSVNGTHFHLNYASLSARILRDVISGPELKFDWGMDPYFSPSGSFTPMNVIVEYSSPNIAKPFHMGHLRSTIIGNFVANIHDAIGHSVTRINFLGDWGNQFGLLMAEITLRELECSSIESIYDLNALYVEANRKAEEDEAFALRGKELFRRLEEGEETLLKQWEHIRDITIRELTKVYSRLDITFDHYHGESMYRKAEVESILSDLNAKDLLEDNELKFFNDGINKKIPLCKSDGSSLYILRDIGAALDRASKFQFHKMYYVVENGQSLHFENLKRVVKALNPDLELEHIKFGRIHGLSSRRGNVVFLSDILDEAKQLCMERQDLSINTRLESSAEKDFAADVSGMTGILRNDMSNKRHRDYPFKWKKIIPRRSDTFQYNHCRLHRLLSEADKSLLESSVEELTSSEELFVPLLKEPEAVILIYHLAIFDEALKKSYEALEPFILAHYLQDLCESISKAFKTLSIKKSENTETARSRILLFYAAKRTLKRGLKILGIQPLDKM